MISAANEEIGYRYGWKPQQALILIILGLALVGGTFLFSLEIRAPVITRAQRVGAKVTAGTPAQVAAAWGTPDAQVPGEQVNANLAGTTCFVWQSKHAILCY